MTKNKKKMVGIILAIVISTVSLSAYAWEWPEEQSLREWRTMTLNWASDIHPDSPTHSELLQETPPPRELWCIESPAPTQSDCAIFRNKLAAWLRVFLEIPQEDPVDDIDPDFPKECSSICDVSFP